MTSASVAEIPAGRCGSRSIGSQRRQTMSVSCVVFFGLAIRRLLALASSAGLQGLIVK
ncbi:MAG: hypothetical protein ABIJ57_01030 [Pseudomonadota bacterium]